MKAKRVVSLLLALLLVAGMLPMAAFATAPAEMSPITVTLKSTGTFGSLRDAMSIWNDDAGDYESVTVDTLEKYSQYVVSANMGTGPNAINVNPTATKFNTTRLENFTQVLSSKAEKSTVAKGERVYITVKVACPGEMIAPNIVHIQYDGNYFEPDPAYKTKTIPNALAMYNGVVNKNVPTAVTDASSSYAGKTFGGTLVAAGSSNAYADATTGKNTFALQFAYNGDSYQTVTTGTDWDYVIPFIAKATVTDSEFKVITWGNNAGTAGGSQYIREEGNTGAFGGGGNTYICQQNDSKITGVSTFVTVTSKEPAVDIDTTASSVTLNPAANQSLKLKLTNATFAGGATASQFHVMNGASEISNAVTGFNASTSTLTIDGTATGMAGATGLTIKVDAAAVTPATGADAVPSGGITTTKTFSVKDLLTGTVTLDASNSHGTSPVYGDTITATYSGNAGTAKYQWKVGGVNKGTDSATYTPAAADVTKTITCTVTDKGTNAKFGSVDSAATTALAKKTLNAPVAADITNVPAIKQGSADKTKTGTYTFKTSNGLVGTDTVTVSYTATYGNVDTAGDVNDVSVVLANTLAGAQAGAYTFAGATVAGVKGNVSEAKYNLTTKPDAIAASVTYAGTNVTGTSVSNAGGEVTGTVAAAGLDGGVLNGVTITGVNGVTATVTPGKDGADGSDAEFKFTLPSTTDVVAVTVTLNVGKGVTTVAFDSLNKTYDGKTDFEGSITTPGVTLSDFGISAIEYDSADVGTGVTINVTPASALGKEITKGEDTFKFPETLTGDITAATAGAISAEVSNIRENAGIDALITAILAAPVKVAGFPDQKTVADYVTVSAPETTKADEIKTLLKTATIGGTPIYTAAAPKTEVTFAADTTETGVTIDANSVAGSTWTFPADTTFVKDDGTELTADELAALGFTADGTKLTLGSEAIAAAGSFNAKISDSKSIAFTVGQITPKEEVAEESWKLVPGDLTVKAATGATLANFSGTHDIDVKVTIKKKGASGGVLYNTNGYATVADEEVEVDESGKITKLTAVTDVVKGASFVGWSTDGTKAHIVKEGATLGEDQEELIAVFDGYMSGMDASTMAPTKKVTRAQLLKMVLEASGQFDYNHDYGKPTKFTDKGIANHWAARWIACAEQLGDKSPISGYEDGTFRPDRQVTREEAALIIARAFGVEVKKGGTTNKVSDFDKVSDWAKDYVAALCDNGTINGLDDGTFGGKRGTQRDAASTMVNKYLGLTEAEKKAIAESAEIQNPYKDVGKGNWAYADLMFASLKVPSSYYQTEITMPTATPATPAE